MYNQILSAHVWQMRPNVVVLYVSCIGQNYKLKYIFQYRVCSSTISKIK